MPLEGRRRHTSERCEETPTAPSSGEKVSTKLRRIAGKARREPEFVFTSVFHLMDEELLRGCFERLRSDAAAGIDRVTKAEYAKDLEANLAELVVKRFLKAGIVEEGKLLASGEGTPQGGVISPLLANIYLHYVLDLWFERRYRRSCRGVARQIRYADDFVVCFEKQDEAERFRRELVGRLAQFSLEVEPSKTKVLEFGPCAAEHARKQGRRKPETFDFLGFTHYCSRSRNGKCFRMKRVTSRKRFRAKLSAFNHWVKANRSRMTTRELWESACTKLRGHYAYYGVTDNTGGIERFAHESKKLLYKWLNRGGGKRRLTWEKLVLMEERFPLPTPRVMVSLF